MTTLDTITIMIIQMPFFLVVSALSFSVFADLLSLLVENILI